MIVGLGIDSVEIKRFVPWTTFSKKKLLRIFSEQEIAYCKNSPRKMAERLAARWTAREAFFKALAQLAPKNNIPLLSLCKLVSVVSKKNAAPQLNVDWQMLNKTFHLSLKNSYACHLSTTHTNHTATSVVVIERSSSP